MSAAALATDLRPEVADLAARLGLDPDRGPMRRWGVPLAEVTPEQAGELLAALQQRQAAAATPARPPRPPDRETTWVAGVLWRAHAACLAKRGEAPGFTAEQLAAALEAGPEVDDVDGSTRSVAGEGPHGAGLSEETPWSQGEPAAQIGARAPARETS